MKVTFQDIRQAIHTLGLSDHALCVHSSLRSFGVVEGGASTVIHALLAEGCTVLVPTFSFDAFAIPPPASMRPERNGFNYAITRGPSPGMKHVYSPDALDIDKNMGAIPAAVLALPEHVRGNHPLCSFTAIGPLAKELVSGQEPLHVYAPLEALTEAGGWLLLMGVGLDSMTFLHLAEQRARRRLFRRWANGPGGQPIEAETGGCSDGFEQFERFLSAFEKRIYVGQSLWRAYPARETLTTASKAILENPQITHCSNPNCQRCNDAILGGPLIPHEL